MKTAQKILILLLFILYGCGNSDSNDHDNSTTVATEENSFYIKADFRDRNDVWQGYYPVNGLKITLVPDSIVINTDELGRVVVPDSLNGNYTVFFGNDIFTNRILEVESGTISETEWIGGRIGGTFIYPRFYPNPFIIKKETTRLKFILLVRTYMTAKIYDLDGNFKRLFIDNYEFPAGILGEVTDDIVTVFDGKDYRGNYLPADTYICTVDTEKNGYNLNFFVILPESVYPSYY